MNKLLKIAVIGTVSYIGAQLCFDLGKSCEINAVKYISPEVYTRSLEIIRNGPDMYGASLITRFQSKIIYYAVIAAELGGL